MYTNVVTYSVCSHFFALSILLPDVYTSWPKIYKTLQVMCRIWVNVEWREFQFFTHVKLSCRISVKVPTRIANRKVVHALLPPKKNKIQNLRSKYLMFLNKLQHRHQHFMFFKNIHNYIWRFWWQNRIRTAWLLADR